jgi:hypothetical protein
LSVLQEAILPVIPMRKAFDTRNVFERQRVPFVMSATG